MRTSEENTNVAIVGLQWGDEGKGKVVDTLSEYFEIVARYQGGANAGHTVITGDKKFILQLVPTGILRPGKIAVIGQGVVVNPEALLHEIEGLEKSGVNARERLKISDRAHLIMPYHRSHEVAAEQARGVGKIGTTAKGIGPTYEDKSGRRGLRTGDLRNPQAFLRKCKAVLSEKDRIASALFDGAPFGGDEWIEEYVEKARELLPMLIDASEYLNNKIDQGKRILFEGAQGTLLDIDHGTYPFVTSSNASAGGASTGTGVGPTRIAAVMGVSKAYTTRVGSGPFPTEILDDSGEELRARGSEYGAVTGRPRRCGWFDVPAARYGARVNGLSAMIVTKLDILDTLDEIPVGMEYEYQGERFTSFPADVDILDEIKVHYRVLPGWKQSTFGLKEFSKLPQKAQDYLHFLSDQVGVEIAMVSTGPEREQAIWCDENRFANLITSR
ncbi:MAG: adenylosuccinate synthase [Acidobacteria bacterium]|nr:MAG: adenylosuccinate synthase [Acidobacteriota bacterium]